MKPMGCTSTDLPCLLEAPFAKLKSVLPRQVSESNEVPIDGFVIADDPEISWTKHPAVPVLFCEFFLIMETLLNF